MLPLVVLATMRLAAPVVPFGALTCPLDEEAVVS